MAFFGQRAFVILINLDGFSQEKSIGRTEPYQGQTQAQFQYEGYRYVMKGGSLTVAE